MDRCWKFPLGIFYNRQVFITVFIVLNIDNPIGMRVHNYPRGGEKMHCCGSHIRKKEELDYMPEEDKKTRKKERMIKSHDHSCCGETKGHWGRFSIVGNHDGNL